MKTKNKKFEYTNAELIMLEGIQNNLILALFDTREKRYVVHRALKEAFMLGTKHENKK
jgi:hypothetical protein